MASMDATGKVNTEIVFLGAAGTVTGSRFLLRHSDKEVLVDAGLFQGPRQWRERNWDEFPLPLDHIEAVIITHAHLDHIGYLPKLFRAGFRGPVYLTHTSADLAEIVLRDSAKLQVEDTEFAKKKGYSRHKDPQPLYDETDAEGVLSLFQTVNFFDRVQIIPGVTAEFFPAGHILGSASVGVEFFGSRVLFSGDISGGDHPLLIGPTDIPAGRWNAVVLESTYGNRRHPIADDSFDRAIARTIKRGGSVVIPAFAVDRTELVLLAIRDGIERGAIPDVPVFVDSPMATKAMAVYADAMARGDVDIRPEKHDPQVLNPGQLRLVTTVEASKALASEKGCIIISASGMATGGRVMHHLKRLLPSPLNTVVLVGYQAVGTKGAQLLGGADSITIHGEDVTVAAEVVDVEGFSVHADQRELAQWMVSADTPPDQVFLVHGEDDARDVLAALLRDKQGLRVVVPNYQETISLGVQGDTPNQP
jgi:metallo-beta-lactamase family protein